MALTDFSVAAEACNSPNFDTKLDASLAHVSTYAAPATAATLSGAGAVPITAPIAHITTTGANALTLADGTDGQKLIIVMIADEGDGTLTPASPGGYSTITFADAGDSVELLFTNSKWYIIGSAGLSGGPVAA